MRRLGVMAFLIVGCSDRVVSGPPDANVPKAPIVETFAVDSVAFGETGGGWKTIGYDLDGLSTDAGDTNVCWLFLGAPQSTQQDGVLGRDNAWSAVVVPILMSAFTSTSFSTDQTQAATHGKWTLQLSVRGLDDTPTQTSTGLTMQVFASDEYGMTTPAFDSTTDWPTSSDSLNDGSDISQGAIAAFADAGITNGSFVAKGDVTVRIHFSIHGVPLRVRVHSPIIAFDHPTPTEITNGVLAGTIDPDELQAAVAGTLGTLSCNGTPPDADVFRQAMDILADRTNAAGKDCSAISFGMSFHGRKIANPTKVAPPPSAVDPCADAGTD